MITEITRGHVRLIIDGRSVKVNGEMLVPTPGLSDFILYKDSITKWDAPFESEPMDAESKSKILQVVKTKLEKMGRVVEIGSEKRTHLVDSPA